MGRLSQYFVFLLIALSGSTLGTGIYTFIYSESYAYLSNDPTTCKNCHAMQDAYDRWQKSSHHHIASCNDCHSSGNIFQKYFGKARSGLLHSYAFTFGYHEPIQIRPFNREITERACRTCHSDFLNASHFESSPQKQCTQCHSQVGHLGN